MKPTPAEMEKGIPRKQSNGKEKGTLAGKATADAILSTWIGPKPGPGGRFKRNILGK